MEQKRADGETQCAVRAEERSLLSLTGMWCDRARVKGQSVLWRRGFRPPCCVINNFLDSMYSTLSAFPNKAALCAWPLGLQRPKDPDKATVACTRWFTHTQTHMHAHPFSPAWHLTADKTQAHNSYLHPASFQISRLRAFIHFRSDCDGTRLL